MLAPKRWSFVYASYFAFIGLWIAFGPKALMDIDAKWASFTLAALSLTYFFATPLSRALSQPTRLGFPKSLALFGTCSGLLFAYPAIDPKALLWSAPIGFFFSTAAYVLCENTMIDELAAAGRAHQFGALRKWGSAGFLVAAGAGGAAINAWGHPRALEFAMALCSLVFLACCLALSLAPYQARHEEIPDKRLATPPLDEPTPPEASDPDLSTPGEPMSKTKRFFGAAAICSMRLAEAIATTWFGAYWMSHGGTATETGLLCALPVAAEFVAMQISSQWLARAPLALVLLAASLGSALRWAATPYCSALWCAIPLQCVHALSFGLLYPAGILWLKAEYGDKFFEARYVLESSSRALGAAVAFAAPAWVIARFGYVAVFGLSAALAALSCAWWIARALGGHRD